MQHTQISCNKKETEIADCETEEAKKINMKSKLHCCSTKEKYNRSYKAVLTTVKSDLDNDIIKKKRK